METPTVTARTYLAVFAVLIFLLALTVAAAYLPLGSAGVPVVLLIASAKMLLIILYFMHVRYASRLQGLVVAGGFLWLIILLTLTLTDYLSRGWLEPASGWLE